MFERLTEKAIKSIMLAQEEARRIGHNFVGTEQLLLGLMGEGTGVAAKALKSMGGNLKDFRVEVEKIIGRGSGFVAVEIPFTPRAKRALELAWDEARQFGHNYIGTEHILLGLIREGEGVAARVLENSDIDMTKVRSHVIRLLGEDAVGRGNQFNESVKSVAKTLTTKPIARDFERSGVQEICYNSPAETLPAPTEEMKKARRDTIDALITSTLKTLEGSLKHQLYEAFNAL